MAEGGEWTNGKINKYNHHFISTVFTTSYKKMLDRLFDGGKTKRGN